MCVPVCKESKTIFGERKQQQQRSSRQTGAYTGVFARHGRLVDGVSEQTKTEEKKIKDMQLEFNAKCKCNCTDYDYYKNSRADSSDNSSERRQRRLVGTRDAETLRRCSFGWLSSRRLCLPAVSAAACSQLFLYASWWCLLCPLRFYFVAIWHFANWPRFSSLCHQKRKFYFVRLKLLRLFFSVLSPRIPCPAERQDFHCRCSGYGYCFPLFIAGDAKSIKDQLLLSISQSERE